MTYSSRKPGSLLQTVRDDISTNDWSTCPELSRIERLSYWSTELDVELTRHNADEDPEEYHGHRVIQRYISVLKLAQQ